MATIEVNEHARDVERGERFAFGRNWTNFLAVVDEERIAEAERSLREAFGISRLDGLSMVDAGSGSGLFSLAARRLGAARVHSFDFDPASVACTRELKRRYLPDDDAWSMGAGSVLDVEYLRDLGTFDLVYSWGVLHHTGAMWRALANVERLVASGGCLYVSIYNDQGLRSSIWRRVKRTYNRLPRLLRGPFAIVVMGTRELLSLSLQTLLLRPGGYLRGWTEYKSSRGMSRWHDLVDWVGGYPFEVAKPEEIFVFFRDRGYELHHLRTCAGKPGCNEYVFRKRA